MFQFFRSLFNRFFSKHHNVRSADVCLYNEADQHIGTISVRGYVSRGWVTEAYSVALEVIESGRNNGYYYVDGEIIDASHVARAEIANLQDCYAPASQRFFRAAHAF